MSTAQAVTSRVGLKWQCSSPPRGRISESRAAPLGLCFIFLPLSCRLASSVAPVRAFQATSFVPKGTRGFSYHMEPEPWVLGSKPWGNSRAPSLAAEYVLTWATPVQTLPERTAGSCVGSGCEQGLAERSREHRKIPKALSCRVLVALILISCLSEREKAMRWTEWTKWPRRNQKKKKTRIVSSKRPSR